MSVRERRTDPARQWSNKSLSDLEQLGGWRSQIALPTLPLDLKPIDEVQSHPVSQSRRLAAKGSFSHWSPSEYATAGDAQILDEDIRPFELVKAFEGIVTDVNDETLIVRVLPLDGNGLEEEAEFLLTDIPEPDRPLVQTGAPLFWFLGYESSGGRRWRTSELKMRRVTLPSVSERWIDAITSIISSPGESNPTEG
jgi:hypothetical protein